MKQIPLTQGMVALVDDEDYERLAQFKWCYRYEGHPIFNIDLLNPRKGATALADFIDKHPDIFKKEGGR